ncbi:MAG: nucleotidyltransferase domain-containing protein [Nitrospiraceae bacterium]
MLDQDAIARPRQIAQKIAALARQVLGADINIIWFGSWPRGTARPHADIDIAIGGCEAFPPERLAELHALIDDVATLHEIDLVDLHTVGETFRDEILRHGVRL